ncbi:MAG: hypothetical protein M3Z09_17005, partial [Acidobacteriota bacterium]|nr:hypothetical protein [Acidobacteriota bacterium]
MTLTTRIHIAGGLIAALLLPYTALGFTKLHIPVDPGSLQNIETQVREAQAEGNYAAQQRGYRRWLEFYPNEPGVQAALYDAMAFAAERSGDAEQAKDLHALALRMNPALDARVDAQPGTATRGDKADKFAAIFAVVAQTTAAIAQQRQMLQQQRQMQGQMLPQGQAQQPPNGYAYPGAPVGAAGYQPPQGPAGAMPGYPQPDVNAGGYQPAAYQPPAGSYQPPSGNQQAGAYPPPAAYQPPVGSYQPPNGNQQPAAYQQATAYQQAAAYQPSTAYQPPTA